MENLYLIAGLGNPGAEYARTRHNAGYLAVEILADRWRAEWKVDGRFNARLTRVEHGARALMLCQPLTYMNLSGEAVGKLKDYFKVATARLMVVVDDADLPLGEIRMRPKGSSGGHHGLESVEQHLGTDRYARLRVGIGRTAEGGREIKKYVLGRFGPEERETVRKVLERSADQVECWLAFGIEKAMSQFNGVVNRSEKKE